jgi:hypothetical protein
MSDDIVKRLRNWSVLPKEQWVSQETAANLIERLRAERDGYSAGNQQTLRALAEANAIAQQYKRERDEARWRLCKVVGDNRGVWGNDIAVEYGWFYLVEATDAK